MDTYLVKKNPRGTASITVPASKSILNRALLLAALASGPVRLVCGTFCEDTRALLGCLHLLGIETKVTQDGLLVHGCGGDIPNKKAELDVKSAGTAARFLPAALAFCGGDYLLTASEQMRKRPMSILPLLSRGGVRFEYLEKENAFPFRMISEGIKTDRLTVNTDESTQYASGLLMASSVRAPFTLALSGRRAEGSYISLTLKTMKGFGIRSSRSKNEITVFPPDAPPALYRVEPDLSGACYFFALALLCRMRILIRGVSAQTTQGDFKFVKMLEARGLKLTETGDGMIADGTQAGAFEGFDEDFHDISDQAMTAAALAPFASTPSHLKNIGHIRHQECDRISAITYNLTALGVPCRETESDVYIQPAAPVTPARIKTFHDHRVAMAFALIGLKVGGVTIEDPDCSKKSFENYFEIIDDLLK